MPGVLYYNGDILTMEPQLYAPAILVESGRIRAVGSKQQLEAAFGPMTPCDESLGAGPGHYFTIPGFRG